MRRVRLTIAVAIVTAVGAVTSAASQSSSAELLAKGRSWSQFLEGARAQREQWMAASAAAKPSSEAVARFARAARGLQLLVVAEDWCPDSVNAVPHVAMLAKLAAVPLVIFDRRVGAGLMDRHRTSDGRIATPTIVLVRDGREVAAWVERPAIVQRWFLSMATSPESARLFGDRQAWFEHDQGRTVLREIIELAEKSAHPE